MESGPIRRPLHYRGDRNAFAKRPKGRPANSCSGLEPGNSPRLGCFAKYALVQSGDTIVDIAQSYGTLSSNVLTSQGTIPDPCALVPGQALLIRLAPQAPQTTHRVVAGETLLIIAQQHNISVAALQTANPNADTYRLQPGQDLSLPHYGASTSGAGAHCIRAWGVDQ